MLLCPPRTIPTELLTLFHLLLDSSTSWFFSNTIKSKYFLLSGNLTPFMPCQCYSLQHLITHTILDHMSQPTRSSNKAQSAVGKVKSSNNTILHNPSNKLLTCTCPASMLKHLSHTAALLLSSFGTAVFLVRHFLQNAYPQFLQPSCSINNINAAILLGYSQQVNLNNSKTWT